MSSRSVFGIFWCFCFQSDWLLTKYNKKLTLLGVHWNYFHLYSLKKRIAFQHSLEEVSGSHKWLSPPYCPPYSIQMRLCKSNQIENMWDEIVTHCNLILATIFFLCGFFSSSNQWDLRDFMKNNSFLHCCF